jgi:hypothetical protein
LGRERAAAITFASSDRDEDSVSAAKHAQTIFDVLGAERLARKVVVDA